jgi:DNA-binding XRE family transcriptional regulator
VPRQLHGRHEPARSHQARDLATVDAEHLGYLAAPDELVHFLVHGLEVRTTPKTSPSTTLGVSSKLGATMRKLAHMTMTTGRIPGWTVADKLRKARESAGFEQAALARELGVAKNTISNYERGAVTPRRSVVMAWAMATGVDLDWLCPRQDSNLQPTDLWVVAA